MLRGTQKLLPSVLQKLVPSRNLVTLKRARDIKVQEMSVRHKFDKSSKKGDIRAPKESIPEFERMVYNAHFLWIPAAGNRMKLSGLYMQATQGPNTTPEPPKTDPMEHAHWIAWTQLGDMSKEEAEKEYIEMVKFFMSKAKADPEINAYGL